MLKITCLGVIMPDAKERPLEDDRFECMERGELLLGQCLNDYMNASAFNDKKSLCFGCSQGATNRYCYARSQPIPGQIKPKEKIEVGY